MMKSLSSSAMRTGLILMLLLSLAVPAFAAVSAKQAEQIAAKVVPADARHLITVDDGNEYEVKFIDGATNTKYKVEVSKLMQKVSEIDSEVQLAYGSNTVKLTVEDVKGLVLAEYPGANIVRIDLDIDDGLKVYEVKFNTNSIRKGTLDINPETGMIIERELKF